MPNGRKYQMAKMQTESHVRRPVVLTNQWQIWVFFSFEALEARTPCVLFYVYLKKLRVWQHCELKIWS